MALSAGLQLRQSQSLVMTPQLMQSIRLLQFSHIELTRFIEQEVERNPLLELVSSESDHGDTGPEVPVETQSPQLVVSDMGEDSAWTGSAENQA
jgi:RNA polymerase sigma-54 factor